MRRLWVRIPSRPPKFKNGLRPLTCGAQRSCHPPFCPTFFRPLLNSLFDHQASAIMVDHTGAVDPASLTQQDCRSVGRRANAKTSTSSRQLDQEKVESFEVFTRHSQRTCRRAVTYFVCGCSTYQSTSTTPGVAGRLSLLVRIEMPKNRFLRSPCATRAILLTSRNVAGAPEIAIHICDPISH